ncbi:MAG: hypothetical protein VW935_20510, partial [Novosphingobium sp.]
MLAEQGDHLFRRSGFETVWQFAERAEGSLQHFTPGLVDVLQPLAKLHDDLIAHEGTIDICGRILQIGDELAKGQPRIDDDRVHIGDALQVR